MMQDKQKHNGDILRQRTHVSGRDFMTLLRFVGRHKWLPFMGLCAGVAVGFAMLAFTPPLYSASARIMVDKNAQRTEAEIVQSLPVLSKVAGVLGLYRDARFGRETIIERLFAENRDDENALRERVLSRLEQMIDVRALEGTGIIDIAVRHANPDRAAQIANVVLSSYRERKMDERFEQSRQLGEWMSKNLDAIKKQVDDAKGALETFKAGHGLSVAGDGHDKAQQLQALHDDIAQADASVRQLKSKLDRADNSQAGATARAALKREEKALLAGLQSLSQRYGEKHPKILDVQARLADVRARLNRKTPDGRKAMEAELAAEQSRLDSLKEKIDLVGKSLETDGKLQTEFSNLEEAVASSVRLYETMLLKYQSVMADAELQEADAKIISMATIPSRPDQSGRIQLIVVLGVSGFLLGLLLVVVRALFNTGFTSTGQLESMTGYPVFASVPDASAKGVAIHHTVIEKPAAILAEALRSLRVALRLRSDTGARGPRVVALTSTLPDEGKTSLAVMLAMIAAKSGERVCVVDCDLRRPSLHKAFGIGNARGLQDYLGHDAVLDDVIYRRDPSGVHLITAKAVPTYSLTLLTSGRMEQLVEALREKYDFIILDAPSSLAFADARVLARMVDQVLYVVAWSRTRREGALASLKNYADMGYESLALVLNKVEMREYLRESASAVVYQYGLEGEDRLAA